ncbi:hypothetical protein GIB67_037378 [Kingdonia uniflora]|uniref:FBD domain-containing protein n=1 Tax=Kingdonia uniflora TaxID=39325 RepID=A0A7J7M8Q7_9MAGN|nr:hypothetical protein GIB67_037378 [Kingdonia uniflora]
MAGSSGSRVHMLIGRIGVIGCAQLLHQVKNDNAVSKTLYGDNDLVISLPTQLSNVAFMELHTGFGKYELPLIACLLKSSPNLCTLIINSCCDINKDEELNFDKEKYWEALDLANIVLLSHLEKFELNEFGGTWIERRLVKHFLVRATKLKEMFICSSKNLQACINLKTEISKELRKTQKASPSSMLMFI